MQALLAPWSGHSKDNQLKYLSSPEAIQEVEEKAFLTHIFLGQQKRNLSPALTATCPATAGKRSLVDSKTDIR